MKFVFFCMHSFTRNVQARNLGHIRSFLLLVSLTPSRRATFAATLGISLFKKDNYAEARDAHAESFDVITRDHVGIIARTQSSKGVVNYV